MFHWIQNKSQQFRQLPLSLRSLIINSTIVAFASFMVTPFLGIYLKTTLHMNTSLVGALIAVSTFVQFGGGIIGAMIAERMGLKRAMVFSLGFRTFGFVLLALSAVHLNFIFPAVFIVAAGSALYLPANRAYIVSSVAPDLKPIFLSISNASLSAGMAAGPLVASLFIEADAAKLFYVVAGLFAILSLVHQFTLQTESEEPQKTSFQGLPSAFVQAGRPAVFSILTFYIYFFFQSFIGLYITAVFSASVFGLVMLINMLTLTTTQPLIAKRIMQLSFKQALVLGYLVFGAGILLLTIHSHTLLFIGTFVMSLGQSVLFLRGDIEVVGRLPKNAALAFGIQRLSTGVGGMLTGLVGGWVFEHFQKHATLEYFWIFVSITCLLAAAAAALWGKHAARSMMPVKAVAHA